MPQIINSNTTLSQVNIASQKAKLIASYQAVIDGINGELGDTTSFLIGGTTYAKADLIAHFQARIDAAKKTNTARAAFQATVASEQGVDATAEPLRAEFKVYLQGRFGKASTELQKFGYEPQKAPQRAAVTKAKAIAQSAATRAARGTIGKKAKSLIKGVPAPAPTAAAPPAQASAPTTTPATPKA
jgi:hypothetical protein